MTGGTGSYLYMAGEVFRHEPYNSKADVYSFAMIMYELISGQCPFRGMDPVAAAMRAAVDHLRPTFGLEPPPHHAQTDNRLLRRVQRLICLCWDPMPMNRRATESLSVGRLRRMHLSTCVVAGVLSSRMLGCVDALTAFVCRMRRAIDAFCQHIPAVMF
jgi:serine/threonine protein kinase